VRKKVTVAVKTELISASLRVLDISFPFQGFSLLVTLSRNSWQSTRLGFLKLKGRPK
jgi:hypothetical protein